MNRWSALVKVSMRYIKSWVFDIGLALIMTAAAATYFTQSETRVVSQPGDQLQFHASYVEYDVRLPIGLAVTGLTFVAVAMRRLKSRDSD